MTKRNVRSKISPLLFCSLTFPILSHLTVCLLVSRCAPTLALTNKSTKSWCQKHQVIAFIVPTLPSFHWPKNTPFLPIMHYFHWSKTPLFPSFLPETSLISRTRDIVLLPKKLEIEILTYFTFFSDVFKNL